MSALRRVTVHIMPLVMSKKELERLRDERGMLPSDLHATHKIISSILDAREAED